MNTIAWCLIAVFLVCIVAPLIWLGLYRRHDPMAGYQDAPQRGWPGDQA